MKSKKNLLELLKSLPYFSKDSLYQLGKQLGLADATVDTYISRFLRHKEILQLKRGLYISAAFFSKNRSNIFYSFYLANIIRMPSYISSWSALQFYNLTTEVIYSITSVTPKVTRSYKTKAGIFTYQSIKEELFSDFSLTQGKVVSLVSPALSAEKSVDRHSVKLDFYIASPAKALFDLLYFKTRQFRGVCSKDAKALVEELRIDVDEMDKKEQSKFYTMIKKYLNDE
jgi:predicted transcriptional regulator of viral defense system